MRLGTSESYAQMERDDARKDVEHEKRAFWSGDHARVTTLDGKSISVIGDITHSVSGPHYLMLCLFQRMGSRAV